ncbi:CDP-Glycerol:Poly(glycerophosphate) glycerophosphotransferase [Micromonospora phaseoli]|uniref:CDP-Glycerol:Poly(Glycerophosphate) glycerophosphotransferase n=1 Tax=Micromonospora phaseoli TaxID=1144548 RepID=A0A1H6UHF8_9ACTN|nr:CDP-glycerol glycerophosphotransferase family protein [Micromonospora phaseoli]PZV98884.1 CDP-glycerol:poly(glycerophosphate) glycerophosphotransferase [Micromonospora phaseoli]GIJ76365.1 glycosyl transferase [Micromonospora phaseoli]SEI87565.1 CDP-Glycerol:Poly(glycerophosphate) glycerophosphotransferase [Micromonospora phaseoli]
MEGPDKSGLSAFLASAPGARLVSSTIEVAALAALLLAAVASSRLWALAPAALAAGLLAWTWRGALRGGPVAVGKAVVPRVLLLAGAYLLGTVHGGVDPALAVGIAVAGLAVLSEAPLGMIARAAYPVTANLPGIGARPYRRPNTSRVVLVNGAAVLVALVCAFTDALGVIAAVVAVAALALSLFTVFQALTRARARRTSEANLSAALTAYEPAFVLHWTAPAGTAYQIAMWLPYLERLDRKFFVLVRGEANFNEAVALTKAPVVFRSRLEDMDDVVTPSMRAAFYVNTATKNNHLIRYTNLTHIQLNHGDSDKVPSHNPAFRIYDKNFVAGQAAIDRFAANGVSMPVEMFTVVGRPQVENVAVAAKPIASIANPRVLYAPTWAGFYADSNYSSLPFGYDIIKALVARGCSIVFRPHPYSRRSPVLNRECDRIQALLAEDRRVNGRPHVFGNQAEAKMSVTDCFNASDVLVSDVSSVVADYLYSEKPFAMVAVSTPATTFTDHFPLARVSYVIDAHGGRIQGLDAALDDLLGSDPLAATRQELKKYYLGDIPGERYAQRFLDEASRYL